MTPLVLKTPPCRLHVIVARKANVAVVIRRGPSKWCHIMRWDLNKMQLEEGAWLKGSLYPARCAISWDGRLFGYFALKGNSKEFSYWGVSKLPWLKALAFWSVGDTWTLPCTFGEKGEFIFQVLRDSYYGKEIGDKSVRYDPNGYCGKVVIQSAAWEWGWESVSQELERGWNVITLDEAAVVTCDREIEAAGHHRKTSDKCPQGRTLARSGPKGSQLLMVVVDRTKTDAINFRRYLDYFRMDTRGQVKYLQDAAWADWDHRGRLLVATRLGAFEAYDVKEGKMERFFCQDLNGLKPDPKEAPEWAQKW
jgi:hypothetical protein